jgi:hypothetical protein
VSDHAWPGVRKAAFWHQHALLNTIAVVSLVDAA